MASTLVTDGSSVEDAQQRLRIDRSECTIRLRYRCPNGHANWEPTNQHIWCQSCSRAALQDDEIDAEHWHIVDERTGEEIPWSAVELVR